MTALESQGRFFHSVMPTTVVSDENGQNEQIIGSLVYENPQTGDLFLNFYSTAFKSVRGSRQDYPQQPLLQSFIVNYPLLAYKSYEPTNNKIALVHLCQNIPQRIIHLGAMEFVAFVADDYDKTDISKQIMILVKDVERNLRLLMFKLDPWKRIDREEVFDLSESCFIFDGNVAQPYSSQENARRFTGDKIKDIQLLYNKTGDRSRDSSIILATLVIQYEHCIATASIKSNNFTIHCEPEEMVREY